MLLIDGLYVIIGHHLHPNLSKIEMRVMSTILTYQPEN